MSTRSRIVATAAAIGALGVVGPVSAASADTTAVTSSHAACTPAQIAITGGGLAGALGAQAGIAAGTTQQATGNPFMAGAAATTGGLMAGFTGATAGMAAGAAALGVPIPGC
jgi:hypothetical protein